MESARPRLIQLPLTWITAVLGLALATAVGLLIAGVLMSPPRDELTRLALYFGIAGSVTMVSAWLLFVAAERVGLSIRGKAFLGGITAAAVALVNVLIIAQLMFVSTEHDLKLLLAAILFSAVVTAFLSLWLAHNVAARLGAITGAVRLLADGDLRARARVIGEDEVASLAEDVNRLGRRLQEAADQRQMLERERRDLTAAISHDLRTPLASLRAMLEALDDEVVEATEVRRYRATMRREIDRLSRMIDDMFELAQLDARVLSLNRKSVAINEIAAEVVDALQPQAKQKGLDVVFAADGAALASVDGARMERAIANLVRNAIQHTSSGGLIEVAVARRNGCVDVTVRDSGEGIETADLSRIWERFYRAEKSRRRDPGQTDGAGLGLAIVRGIVEAHGGSVSAESTPGRGSAFRLELPAAGR